MTLCVHAGIVAMIFLGAGWIDSGDMQIGEIMAFITYMAQIMGSLGMISAVLNMFGRVKASHERIGEVFGAGQEPDSAGQDAPDALRDSAHIAFENVGFAYKGSTGQAALSGLDFQVSKGETLGVIGPTGSGKSTLAALLARFYNVSQGAIKISGVPIEHITVSELRARTAVVPQTATLFTGTIRENILWGRENASDEQLEKAAKTAEAYDFITDMQENYDTLIGQNGVNLSGGQKQRVSIARALIREPDILILDDCTSALDAMTEARVKRAIRQFSENMTCVLITQRVNTAMTCDKILVLDGGSQAGFGVHAELFENCPVYRDIYMSQIGKEENIK
jgi:ATP-binding cassette subfamily B protein